MSDSRQTFSIWFYLFGVSKNYGGSGKSKWRFPSFIKRKMWRNKYFWQDSFFTYWNRFLGCSLFGHKTKEGIYDDTDKKLKFCFKCYRAVEK